MAKSHEGKLRVDLVPRGTIRAIASIMGQISALQKYEDWDWQTMWPEDYYAACIRHLEKWWGGEDYDGSGHLHIAHVLTSASIMLFLVMTKGRNPDRLDAPVNHRTGPILQLYRDDMDTESPPYQTKPDSGLFKGFTCDLTFIDDTRMDGTGSKHKIIAPTTRDCLHATCSTWVDTLITDNGYCPIHQPDYVIPEQPK